MNLIGILVSVIFVFAIIFISDIFSKKGILKEEGSRKFIHIGVSNWWIIAMIFFKSNIYAAVVPFLFIIINYISYKKNIFSSMERNSEKNSPGTVFYAISLFILSLITFSANSSPYIGAAGILTMGYGDGFAAVFGKKFGKKKIKFLDSEKSIIGSLFMFIFTFVIIFILMSVSGISNRFFVPVLISFVAMLTELFSPFGTDNLTVPLLVSFIYYIFNY